MWRSLSRLVVMAAGALLVATPALADGDLQPQQEQPQQQQPGVGGAGTEDQPAEPAAQQFQISGQVERVSPDENLLRLRNVENNFVVPLRVEEQSNITLDGEKIALDRIPEGAEIRASYSIEGDRLVASEITVSQRQQQQQQQPGAGGAGEAGGGAQREFFVRGEVADAAQESLQIRQPEQDFFVDIQVPDDALVLMEGRKISVSEIPEGAQVRATYTLRGNDLVAETIIATPASEPGQPDRLEPAPPAQPESLE